MKRILRKTALAVAMTLAFSNAYAVLERQGPVSNSPSVGGYPAWYMDTTGLTLEFCDAKNQAENAGGWCLLTTAGPVPETFPTNFLDEHFWYSATAAFPAAATSTAVKAILWETAIEAAFAADVVPGGQIAFTRIRFRLDANTTLPAGTYTFTHPYGQDVVTIGAGEGRIFVTEDVGIACPAGQFDCFLASTRVGPFLVPSDTIGGPELPAVTGPAPGKLYLADPGRVGPVTGSSLGAARNMVRIDGPVGAGAFGGQDSVETSDFSLVGRLFQGTIESLVRVERSSYEEASGQRKVDVLAKGEPTTQARMPGQPRPAAVTPNLSFINAPCNTDIAPPGAPLTGGTVTQMVNAGTSYWGQLGLALTDPRPASICVRDTGIPATPVYFPAVVTDHVDVTVAEFDPTAGGTLTVTASSTEPVSSVDGALTVLTVEVPGAPVPPVTIVQAGTATVTPLAAPPALVAVHSSLGGRTVVPVKIGFATGGGVQDLPIALNDSFTLVEDSGANLLDVLGNDVGGRPVDPATLTVDTAPLHGTATVSAGQISYTPFADYFGPDSFSYTVNGDNGTLSNVATVNLAVTGVNDAPVAVNDAALAIVGVSPATINLLANDTDADGAGDLVSAVIQTLPTGGTLTAGGQPVLAGAEVVGGQVVYTPAVAGQDSFTYLAKDSVGVTSANPATVTVTSNAPETLTFINRLYNDSGTSVGRWLIRGTSSIDAGQILTFTVVSVNGVPADIPLGTVIVAAGGVFDFRISKVTDGNAVDVGAAGILRIQSTTGMVLDTPYNYVP